MRVLALSATAPWMGGKTAPPATPMTRIPAPRRVWVPRFAVPRVKIVGYLDLDVSA